MREQVRSKLPTLRKARSSDVPALYELINRYAAERLMLPRTLPELYENVCEFTVAEEDGRVLGCGALKLYNDSLAEIRSLSVEPDSKNRGLGGALAAQLLLEARRSGLKTVFALTSAPDFFRKCGFWEVAREKFPAKIWRDCLQCEFYPTCQEKTMAVDLAARKTSRADSRRQPAAVPA